jgi:hypothetical protein
VLPNALIYNKLGQIFPVKVLAGGSLRIEQDRVVFKAKSSIATNVDALARIVNAIATAEQLVHGYTFAKYFWIFSKAQLTRFLGSTADTLKRHTISPSARLRA